MPATTASTPARPSPADATLAALDFLAHLLSAPFHAADLASFTSIAHARRTLAETLDSLGSSPPRATVVEPLLDLAKTLAAHPASAIAVPAPIYIPGSSGWLADLVRLFAAPAWQTPAARPLFEQPTWLWPAQARHLFAAPAFLPATADEHRWADHLLSQLQVAVRLIESNRGSSSARTVAHLATTLADTWPAFGTPAQLRARQHALARLRTLLAPRLAPFTPPPRLPDRPLRVCLLTETCTPVGDTYAPSRLTPLLDHERVELTALSLDTLPADLAQQIETVRASAFDAVVFAGDLTRDNGLSAVALHRVSPRQFATAHSPITTGLPEIDVYLAGPDAAPDTFTERLAHLPSALAFERPPEPAEDQPALTRDDLGLPANARLVAVTVDAAHTTAALRAEWQRQLDNDPATHLVLLPGAASPALDLLLAELERQFGPRQISAGNTPLEPNVLSALLRVCDAYLPHPAGIDAFTVHLARHSHVPFPAHAHSPAPFATPLAFADALADILEQACHATTLSAVVNPAVASAAPPSFHTRGKALLDAARPARAMVYLLAAVESPDAAPDVWHDLALALHADGQRSEAIDALTTCVRLDPSRLEPWLLLADWARNCGHDDLFREVAAVVNDLAPADARVVHLLSTIAA